MNLAKQLTNQAKEQGNRLFSVRHDYEMTYAQMEEAASKMAAGLMDQGISKGDAVAWLIPNTPPFFISFFAIQKLGAVAVPINLLLKPDEVAYILNDSGAKMVIALDMMAPVVDAARSETQSVEKFVVIGENVPEWGLSFSQIVAFLEEHLAKFKVPRTVEFRDELPKGGSGKILRRMIRDE